MNTELVIKYEKKLNYERERESILTGSSSQLEVAVCLLEGALVLELDGIGCCTCDCFKASNLSCSFFIGWAFCAMALSTSLTASSTFPFSPRAAAYVS